MQVEWILYLRMTFFFQRFIHLDLCVCLLFVYSDCVPVTVWLCQTFQEFSLTSFLFFPCGFSIICCHLQNDIRKNPTFRSQFHEMCAKVGVDPLASNKGFWAELLGIGDFYYELGSYYFFLILLFDHFLTFC